MSDSAAPSPQDIIAAIAALEAQGIAVPQALVHLRDHHAAALRRSPSSSRPQGHPATQELLNHPPNPRPFNNTNDTSTSTLPPAALALYPPTPPLMSQRRAQTSPLPPSSSSKNNTLSSFGGWAPASSLIASVSSNASNAMSAMSGTAYASNIPSPPQDQSTPTRFWRTNAKFSELGPAWEYMVEPPSAALRHLSPHIAYIA
ncbi:hypothetical protein B0H11DRAFT_2235706 [Mycena galericulata]|nr:hypothetical protein B0H11DRAFT_2235706 [Mycena galericulata]